MSVAGASEQKYDYPSPSMPSPHLELYPDGAVRVVGKGAQVSFFRMAMVTLNTLLLPRVEKGQFGLTCSLVEIHCKIVNVPSEFRQEFITEIPQRLSRCVKIIYQIRQRRMNVNTCKHRQREELPLHHEEAPFPSPMVHKAVCAKTTNVKTHYGQRLPGVSHDL